MKQNFTKELSDAQDQIECRKNMATGLEGNDNREEEL